MALFQPGHSLLLHDPGTSATRRVEAKMADAVARGEKMVHVHRGDPDEARARVGTWLPDGLLDSDQVEMISASEERERAGGRAEPLLAALKERLVAARGAGYPGVTCSTDSGALLDLLPDPDELLAYERGLHELGQDATTTVLCCYPLDRVEDSLAQEIAAVHWERVHDALWTSRTRGGILCVDGELEESNRSRLSAVLSSAVDQGLTTVDLRAVTFLAPAAIAAFEQAAARAGERNDRLRLIRVPAIVHRAFEVSGLVQLDTVEVHPSEPPAPEPGGMAASSLRVAEVFGELSRLEEATNEVEASAGLARIVAGVIAPAQHLSVTLGEPANPRVIDSTSQEAQKLDGLQMQADEGPCQSAWEERRMVLTADLRADPRWPVLRELAGPTDVVSVLALPVTSDGEMIGVINAYSEKADAFGRLDVALAELAAYVVGQVFRHVHQTRSLNDMVANLRTALTSRSEIDQAKGILMERHGYTADEAFTALSRLSQQQNVKVRDLAALLTSEAASD